MSKSSTEKPLVVEYQGKEQRAQVIGMDRPETRYYWKTKEGLKKSGQDLKTIIPQEANFYQKV